MVGDFLAGGLFVLQPVQKVTAAIVLTQPLQSLPVDAEQLCQAAFLDRQRSAVIAIFMLPFHIFLCQTGKSCLNKLFNIMALFIGDKVFLDRQTYATSYVSLFDRCDDLQIPGP